MVIREKIQIFHKIIKKKYISAMNVSLFMAPFIYSPAVAGYKNLFGENIEKGRVADFTGVGKSYHRWAIFQIMNE